MARIWSIKSCMEWTLGYLERKQEKRPRLAAEWLLSAATGLSRLELYMNYDRPLSPSELACMHDYVSRRAQREPLQYITGETQFRKLRIFCESGVLIPRPETELLVEEVLRYIDEKLERTSVSALRCSLSWAAEREKTDNLDVPAQEAPSEQPKAHGSALDSGSCVQVLDLGCGTGCISLALASECGPYVSCIAVDISPSAIALAKRNRDSLGLSSAQVELREGDLYAPLSAEEYHNFDVLVSNPPYIPQDILSDLPQEVRAFEPELALAGGADGLDVYRRILAGAQNMLRKGGLFACELHENSLEAAAALALAAGLSDVRVVHDLADRPRILLACMP